MIVEGAFLKIPEILLTHEEPDSLYEANITNLFTNGIILELNARNIDNPLRKINMEKRYNPDINTRCDIYLDFSSFIDDDVYLGYGIKSKSWVEAKYFGGINRNKGNETRSENAGSIVYDIFRTIYYTHLADNIGHAKYSINIFNENPSRYLAFKRRNGKPRKWINSLLASGISKLHFDLEDEPNSIRKIFTDIDTLILDITLKNTSFEPVYSVLRNSQFYGYMNQVIDYEIIVNGEKYNG